MRKVGLQNTTTLKSGKGYEVVAIILQRKAGKVVLGR